MQLCALSLMGQSEIDADSVSRCGAGRITFEASSSLEGTPGFNYNWYRINDATGDPEFVASLPINLFVTDELISTATYRVNASNFSDTTDFITLLAIIENTAEILESPEIQLCDSVFLNATTTFTGIDIDSASFQWQEFVVFENNSGTYVDIPEDEGGTDSLQFVAKKAGFYRVVITNPDGCKAVSESVEVTTEPLVIANILTADAFCVGEETVTLTSDYTRDIASYLWEYSSDGVSFTQLSTDSSVELDESVFTYPLGQDSAIFYFRLTVTEQNCADTTTVQKIFYKPPQIEISHMGSTDDFFYCPTDPVNERILVANQIETSYTDVEFYWARLQGPPDNDKSYYETEEIRDLIYIEAGFPTNPQITLGEDDWGWYVGGIKKSNTDCIISSNVIFVESAIPLVVGDTAYCQVLDSAFLGAYFPNNDTYTWVKEDGSVESDSIIAYISTDNSGPGRYK